MSSPRCSPDGELDRRNFLLLAAAACAAGGCQSVTTSGTGTGGAGHVVDAGPASQITPGSINATHKSEGFFLTRRNGEVVAISSYCTHRRCTLDPEGDNSFHCPCHGSRFDPAGKVVQGPATRNLPILPTKTDARGHVLVTVTG